MTKSEARRVGLVQLTEDERPTFMIQTTRWGDIMWSDWCSYEAMRIRDCGREARVVDDGNKLSVWASPVELVTATPKRAQP